MQDCDICYVAVKPSCMISMTCCNDSKNICRDCLKCLKVAVCPFCRQDLDLKLVPNAEYSSSLPNIYSLQLDQEESDYYLIDPYQIQDSRALRRQIRSARRRQMRFQRPNSTHTNRTRSQSVDETPSNNTLDSIPTGKPVQGSELEELIFELFDE